MADLPDLGAPLPDLAHESLRQSVVAALERIEEHVDRLANSFLLSLTAMDFAQTVLAEVVAMQHTGDQMQAGIASLSQTVAAQAQQIAALQQQLTLLTLQSP